MKRIVMFSLLAVLLSTVSVVSVSAEQNPPVPPDPPNPTATPEPPQPVPRCNGEIGQGIITNDTPWDIWVQGDIDDDGNRRTENLRPGENSLDDTTICDVDWISVRGAYFTVFPSASPGRLYGPDEWSYYLWGDQRCVDRSAPNFNYANCSTAN